MDGSNGGPPGFEICLTKRRLKRSANQSYFHDLDYQSAGDGKFIYRIVRHNRHKLRIKASTIPSSWKGRTLTLRLKYEDTDQFVEERTGCFLVFDEGNERTGRPSNVVQLIVTDDPDNLEPSFAIESSSHVHGCKRFEFHVQAEFETRWTSRIVVFTTAHERKRKKGQGRRGEGSATKGKRSRASSAMPEEAEDDSDDDDGAASGEDAPSSVAASTRSYGGANLRSNGRGAASLSMQGGRSPAPNMAASPGARPPAPGGSPTPSLPLAGPGQNPPAYYVYPYQQPPGGPMPVQQPGMAPGPGGIPNGLPSLSSYPRPMPPPGGFPPPQPNGVPLGPPLAGAAPMLRSGPLRGGPGPGEAYNPESPLREFAEIMDKEASGPAAHRAPPGAPGPPPSAHLGSKGPDGAAPYQPYDYGFSQQHGQSVGHGPGGVGRLPSSLRGASAAAIVASGTSLDWDAGHAAGSPWGAEALGGPSTPSLLEQGPHSPMIPLVATASIGSLSGALPSTPSLPTSLSGALPVPPPPEHSAAPLDPSSSSSAGAGPSTADGGRERVDEEAIQKLWKSWRELLHMEPSESKRQEAITYTEAMDRDAERCAAAPDSFAAQVQSAVMRRPGPEYEPGVGQPSASVPYYCLAAPFVPTDEEARELVERLDTFVRSQQWPALLHVLCDPRILSTVLYRQRWGRIRLRKTIGLLRHYEGTIAVTRMVRSVVSAVCRVTPRSFSNREDALLQIEHCWNAALAFTNENRLVSMHELFDASWDDVCELHGKAAELAEAFSDNAEQGAELAAACLVHKAASFQQFNLFQEAIEMYYDAWARLVEFGLEATQQRMVNTIIRNLAEIHGAMGQAREGEALLERLQMATAGPTEEELVFNATVWRAWGDIATKQRMMKKAAGLYDKALACFVNVESGHRGPEYIHIILSKMQILVWQGRSYAAWQLYGVAWDYAKYFADFGTTDFDHVGLCVRTWKMLLPEAPRQLFAAIAREFLALQKTTHFASETPMIAYSLFHLGNLSSELGLWGKAVAAYLRSEEMLTNVYPQYLPVGHAIRRTLHSSLTHAIDSLRAGEAPLPSLRTASDARLALGAPDGHPGGRANGRDASGSEGAGEAPSPAAIISTPGAPEGVKPELAGTPATIAPIASPLQIVDSPSTSILR
eukprot:tig00000622_g2628.t1